MSKLIKNSTSSVKANYLECVNRFYKPKVCIDCDGVLLDFVENVVKTLNKYNSQNKENNKFVVRKEPWRPEDLDRWNFFELLSPEEDSHLKWELTKISWWEDLNTVSGAEKAIQDLRELGCDITILTSPYLSCIEWANQRYKTLLDRFNIQPNDVIIAHKKWLVNADFFIDDKAEHVLAMRHYNPDCVSFVFKSDRYKQHIQHDWGQIVRKITDHVVHSQTLGE